MAEAKSRARQNGDFDTIFDDLDPIPIKVMTSDSVDWVKPQKIALTSTPQKVTLDSLLGMQITSRGSAVISCSTFGNEDGVAQVETNTIASAVTLGGDLDVIVAGSLAGLPITLAPSVLGTLQVESATCTAGESTGAGNITVTVTAAGMSNSPKAVVVPIAASDTVDLVGLALRTALAADADVASFFTVSGATDTAILTSLVAIADDVSMAMVSVDTDGTGVTFSASADTTAGVAASTAAEIAEIVKDEINANIKIAAGYTATRSGDDVILTADAVGANDATLNISVETGTATGLTASLLSVTTTEGYAVGTWDEIGGQGTLTIEPPPMATNSSPFTSIWMKTTTTVNAMIRGWKAV